MGRRNNRQKAEDRSRSLGKTDDDMPVGLTLDQLTREVLSFSTDPVAITYCHRGSDIGEVAWINNGLERAFGVNKSEAVGQPARIFHGLDHWNDLAASIKGDLGQGTRQFQSRMLCLRSDGGEFWSNLWVHFLDRDEAGGRFCILAYRDIAQTQAVEAAPQNDQAQQELASQNSRDANSQLEAMQSRMAYAIEAHTDPMAVFDPNGALITANSAYARTVAKDPSVIQPGMDIRTIIDTSIDDGLFPEPQEGRAEFCKRIYEHRASTKQTVRVQVAGGAQFLVTRSLTEAGDLVVVLTNITDIVKKNRDLEKTQCRLEAAVESFPGPYCIYDKDHRLVRFNQAYREICSENGLSIALGMHISEVFRSRSDAAGQSDSIGQEEDWLSDAMSLQTSANGYSDLRLSGDRHYRAFVSTTADGDTIRAYIDITEMVRQTRRSELIEDRLTSAINTFPDAFALYDKDLKLVLWNPAYGALATNSPEKLKPGMLAQEVTLLAAKEGLIPGAAGREEEWVADYYASRDFRDSDEMHEADGDVHYRVTRATSPKGEVLVLRANVTQLVRQRRALEETYMQLTELNRRISRQALRDELTGLGNRRFLTEKFEELMDLREVEGGEISILSIDLDRFKQINDTMGHSAGDLVLKTVANRLNALIGPNEWAARNGGDEFIVLIWEKSLSTRPAELAERLVKDLPKDVLFEGRECRFGASVGVATTPLSDIEQLISNSDVALYRAKKAGRGQVGIFDKRDQAERLQKLELANDILQGLELSEFEPFFQPQVDSKTGRIIGIEALARWRHPKRGLLAPIAFLDTADDLNVIPRIDRIIFEKAIALCSNLPKCDGTLPSLSFNVSAGRIKDDDFEAIKDRLSLYDGEIVFELLETIYLEEEDTGFLFQLDNLRDMGISIEIDDFGSGRASIVALQRIGPDRLKIDRRLIAPIVGNEKAQRLVRSIIEIGNALDIGLVAEGVETVDHTRILRDLGVARLQGYYYAPPLPFSEFLTLYLNNLNQPGFNWQTQCSSRKITAGGPSP